MGGCSLAEIFDDRALVAKIRERLPYLFQLAELEASRGGKVGMEVGSIREQIVVALLIYKFGRHNVEVTPITTHEADILLCGQPVSIKTAKGTAHVKAIWTVDKQKVEEFVENYLPRSEMLLVQVNWGARGKFAYIPLQAQLEVFREMGRQRYLRPPKPNTNPRGVEISGEALRRLLCHSQTRCIDIDWRKSEEISYDPYTRWIGYWEK